MNRFALLVVVAACGSDEECVPDVGSRVSFHIGSIASGRELTGVSWIEKIGTSAPIHHAAFIVDGGGIEREVRVGSRQLFGTAGTESVLWHAAGEGTDCEGLSSFGGLLHRRDDNLPIDIAPVTIARSVAFDGQRYQLFWVDDDVLFHRTLDEHGVLGPEHDLGDATGCISATSDRAGITYLRMASAVYIIDGATGGMRPLWVGPAFEYKEPIFYFAGALHIPDNDLISIDPVTGTSRTRELPDYIFRFYPAATTLYGDTGMTTLQLDSALNVVEEYRVDAAYNGFGTSGDDRIYLERAVFDAAGADTRSHVVLSRAGSNPWTYELALDSPLETLQSCEE